MANIKELEKLGAFVGAPVKRVVEWEQQGQLKKITVYIKPLSVITVYACLDVTDNAEKAAAQIAASVFNDNGEPLFTVNDVLGLNDPKRGALNVSLTNALLNAITDVNNLGK